MENVILKEKLNSFEDKRLAMFVICCHVDKMLTEDIQSTKYDLFIQAGAALTDKRVCELNDYDLSDDSISDRNQRYSEMTAMYWIGKNIQTDYVGIAHYRRRFAYDSRQLSELMDQGFDIITTNRYELTESVCNGYCSTHYSADWKLFMDILKEYAPDYTELADREYNLLTMHPCNMNIMSAEMYDEYCKWIFPILDAFNTRSVVKTDVYQRRDVGFIGERLSSLFVEKKRLEGRRIIEAPINIIKSKGWEPQDECDLADYDSVMEACRRYYAADDITRCRQIIAEAIKTGKHENVTIYNLARLFMTAIDEQHLLPATMYEYLPDMWRSDLDTLLSAYMGLKTIVTVLGTNRTKEAEAMFGEFMASTGFSRVAVISQCKNAGITDEGIIGSIVSLM